MIFEHKTFSVDIAEDISLDRLRWPLLGEAGHDAGLGLNREYQDLRGASWKSAKMALEEERRVILQIETSLNPEVIYDDYEDERFAEGEDLLFGLDIGVASTVLSLSAARCIPFSSCNGAAFFGHHKERHPLVAFFARREALPLLSQAANESNAGLSSNEYGELIVYSNHIRSMLSFSTAIIKRSKEFRALKFTKGQNGQTEPPLQVSQGKLL